MGPRSCPLLGWLLQLLGWGCVLPGRAPVPLAPAGAPVNAGARLCQAFSYVGAALWPELALCPPAARAVGTHSCASPGKQHCWSELCQHSPRAVTPGPQSSRPQPALHPHEGGGAGPGAGILLGKGKWKLGSQQLINAHLLLRRELYLELAGLTLHFWLKHLKAI